MEISVTFIIIIISMAQGIYLKITFSDHIYVMDISVTFVIIIISMAQGIFLRTSLLLLAIIYAKDIFVTFLIIINSVVSYLCISCIRIIFDVMTNFQN